MGYINAVASSLRLHTTYSARNPRVLLQRPPSGEQNARVFFVEIVMAELFVTRRDGRSGKILVDDADSHVLVENKWYLVQARMGKFYARSSSGFLHRLIACPPKNRQVDHINGDPLDNRRCNLRICTRQQNLCNRAAWGASVYLGVGATKPWVASISVNGKQKRLGSFYTEKAAALAYDCAARVQHGDFAKLNFPDVCYDMDTIKALDAKWQLGDIRNAKVQED